MKKSHKGEEKCKLCGFEPKPQEALAQHVMSEHLKQHSEPKVEKVDAEWVDESPDIAPKIAHDEPEARYYWNEEEEKCDNSAEEAPVSCFEAKEAIGKLKKFLQQSEIGENVDIETMTLSDMSAFVDARTTINSLKKSLNCDRNKYV